MEPLSDEKARRFLEQAMVAHLGVIADGEPYVTPMSFVVDGDRLLFRTKPGRRFSAIESHPRVAVEVSHFDPESGDWTSVLVSGTARESRDPDVAQLTLEKLYAKYRDALGSPLSRGGMQPMATLPHVVVLEMEEVSGMQAGGPFSQRTRPGRL